MVDHPGERRDPVNLHDIDPPLEFVEIHDAYLNRSIALRTDGAACIGLTNVGMYFARSSERFEVWSWEAEIVCAASIRLVVDGPISGDDRISDHIVTRTDGAPSPDLLAMMANPMEVETFALRFTSGAVVAVTARAVQLIPKRVVARRADWRGPLRSPA